MQQPAGAISLNRFNYSQTTHVIYLYMSRYMRQHCLTPSLNHNLVKLRLRLNSSRLLVGNAFVNPSAT